MERVLLLGTLRVALEEAGMMPSVLVIGNSNRFALRVSSEAEAKLFLEGEEKFIKMTFHNGSGRTSEVHLRNLDQKRDPEDPIFRIEWDCVFDPNDMTHQFMSRIKGGPQKFEECMDPRDLACLMEILLGRPVEPIELVVPSTIRRKGHRDDRVVPYPIGQLKLSSPGAGRYALCLRSEMVHDAFQLGYPAAADLEDQWNEPVEGLAPSAE